MKLRDRAAISLSLTCAVLFITTCAFSYIRHEVDKLPPPEPHLTAGAPAYLLANHAVCISEEILRQLISFSVEYNMAAAEDLFAHMQCILAADRTRVTVLDIQVWGGVVEVRLSGNGVTVDVWGLLDSFKPINN